MPSFESKIPKPVNDVTQSLFAQKKPEPLLPDIMEEEKLSAAKDNDAEQQQFSNEPGAEQKPEQHALAGENAETDPDMQWQRGIAAKIQQARENDPNMQWRRDLEAKIEESNQNDPNMQWRRGIEAKLEARSKAQLSVSQPDDSRELEADKKSEEVTSPPGPLSKFERGSDARSEETLAAKGSSGGEVAVDRETKDYINNLPAGQSLPLKIKNFFQTRFGRSFNKVKIHNDRQANEAAAAINAKAFTKGNDIVFGEGQYQPDTTDGKKLMAHELTHVAQQGSIVQRMTGFDMVPPDQQKDYRILTPIDASKDEILKMLHVTLDLAGLIPALGIIFDSTNVILYVAEDDWKNAGFSAAAMIPIFGQGATVTKYGLKVSKKVIEKIGKTKLAKGFKKLAEKFRPTQGRIGGKETNKRLFSSNPKASKIIIEDGKFVPTKKIEKLVEQFKNQGGKIEYVDQIYKLKIDGRKRIICGKFYFENGKPKIYLYKGADEATFIHEFVHFRQAALKRIKNQNDFLVWIKKNRNVLEDQVDLVLKKLGY